MPSSVTSNIPPDSRISNGRIRVLRRQRSSWFRLCITNFDKCNHSRSVPAPPGLSSLLFETLLTGTMDEPTTGYGLLAEDITVASDSCR